MKVLLLLIYNSNMFENMEDLGVCYIASYLRKIGHEVMLIGKNENDIDYDKILDFKPDIIGLPVYIESKYSVYGFCRKIKDLMPEVLICLGGYQATYDYMDIMKEAPFVDFIIRGEGEITWAELVKSLEGNRKFNEIEGLVFRNKDEIVVNKNRAFIDNLDSLPFPARDVLCDNNIGLALISTSRGCMAACSFCSTNRFWKKWRGRSPGNIVDEIEHIVKQYGRRVFFFTDGSFEDPDNKCERLVKIAKEIKRRDLTIFYAVHFRADIYKKITDDVMELLKETGLIRVLVGIEAANEYDLKIYGKKTTVEDNYKVVDYLRSMDVVPDIGFINFNPYSLFENLHKNIDFLEKKGFASSIIYIKNRLRAFKGTVLYDRLVKDGLLRNNLVDDSYNYDYVDPRVKQLAEYVNNHEQIVKMKYNNTFKPFHYPDYLVLLTYYKRLSMRDNDMRLYNYIREHEEKVKIILADLNSRHARWFRELAELAERNWNYDEAEKISASLLGKDYLLKINESIIRENARLRYKILKLGNEYEMYMKEFDF